ncbi:unnamed protein product [Prorocentrum cordatum]|uniref:Uncharacterized protein n=1 Tax=Prorocentrum cordatum TaxID=2364126 RepID=A0ABN9Y316_9DINO|nr:unnamed protein product [Polarella glacialis]
MGPKKDPKKQRAVKAETKKHIPNKPAAENASKWHDSDLAAVPVKSVKSTNVGDDAKSEDDGVPDDRQTSRAQRYAIETHQADTAEKDWKRYQGLGSKDCEPPGKMKERAKIANTYVSRSVTYKSELDIKSRTIEMLTERTTSKGKEDTVLGMQKHTMIGRCSAGNESLFQKAVDAKEVYESEVDGMWYTCSKKLTVSDVESQRVHGLKIHDAKSDDAFRAALADLVQADNHDIKILQGSFDSVTQVTSARNRVAVELCKNSITAAGSDMARRGVQGATKQEVAAALQAAAQPYRQLVEYYNELAAIHKHHAEGNASSSSSSGSKFKALHA